MDASVTQRFSIDAQSQSLVENLTKVRDERDSLKRVVDQDGDTLRQCRASLDALCSALLDEVYRQHQGATDRRNFMNALQLELYGSYRGFIYFLLALVAIALYMSLGPTGPILAVGLYAGFVLVAFLLARTQSAGAVKKALKFLGNDGKDMRFVAFARFDAELSHPLLGFDGPTATGELQNRAWKIPDLRTEEALSETFLEVMDLNGLPAMLSRFPGKTPIHLFADTSNGFIGHFGVYLQRAIERHLRAVNLQGKVFRTAVMRFAQLEETQNRLIDLEKQFEEYERTRRIWEAVILPDDIKNAIARRVEMFRLGAPGGPRGLILYGAPGTGKRHLARSIARVSEAAFVRLSPAAIDPDDPAKSAQRIHDIFAEAHQMRSVIFVDQFERITGDLARAFVGEWDSIRDEDGIWVIGATTHRELLDESLAGRFGALVEIPLPDAGGRRKIVEDAAERLDLRFPLTDRLVDVSAGLTANVLEEVVQRCVAAIASGDLDDERLADIIQRVRTGEPPPARDKAAWDDLVLNKATMERLQSYAANMPAALLLYGPPGTGKTAIAEALARDGELAFIPIPSADALGGVVEFVDLARSNTPSLLFFDDVDQLVTRNDVQLGDASKAAIAGQLVRAIDEIRANAERVYVVVASSHPDRIEDQVRSRFLEALEIGLPDRAARAEIVRRLLRGRPLGFPVDDAANAIADRTAGHSGAELRSTIDQATQRAVMRSIELGTPGNALIELADLNVEATA